MKLSPFLSEHKNNLRKLTKKQLIQQIINHLEIDAHINNQFDSAYEKLDEEKQICESELIRTEGFLKSSESAREKFDIIKKDYGRIKAQFKRFEFKSYVGCYVELKITRKVPKTCGGFEMKEFIFNGNSLHIGNKCFRKIPNYEAMAKRWNVSVFNYIYKDFGIMPFEYYKNIWI